MLKQVDDFVADVRVAIDMNRTDNALIKDADTETARLNELIRSKLCDAVRLTETECPVSLLEGGISFIDRTCDVDDSGRVTISLPADFMRLVAFEMSDWDHPVYEAIDETDAAYLMLRSPYRGISGSPERPAVAIATKATGRVLEGYSSASTAGPTVALYRALPVIDEIYIKPTNEVDVEADSSIDLEGEEVRTQKEYIEVAPKCYQSAVYRAAYLTLLTVGDQLAPSMLELAKSLLQ